MAGCWCVMKLLNCFIVGWICYFVAVWLAVLLLVVLLLNYFFEGVLLLDCV